jgi:hypothetical protein
LVAEIKNLGSCTQLHMHPAFVTRSAIILEIYIYNKLSDV